MSKATYRVTGKTFDLKNKIKASGGKWDAANKSWTVELFKGDSLWRYEGDLTFTKIDNDKPVMRDFGYQESADSEGL